MKLPSVDTDLGFRQIFENSTAGRNSRCRSGVNNASWELRAPSCELQLLVAVPVPTGSRSRNEIRDARLTGERLGQFKQHSVTNENGIHIGTNFLDYKYLGNRLLQYCPQSWITLFIIWFNIHTSFVARLWLSGYKLTFT